MSKQQQQQQQQQASPYQLLGLAVALLLDVQIAWGTDGLPPFPRAWVLLWQTLPHLAPLWKVHGMTAGLAFAGLVALSLMQAALWLGFVLLLWHIGKGIMQWRRNVLPTPVTMPVQLAASAASAASTASAASAASTPTTDVLPVDTTHRRVFLGPETIPSPVLEGGERAMPLALPSSSSTPCLSAPSSLPPNHMPPATHRMLELERILGVPVTLDAATLAAPTPWIACQVAVREGVMPDEHGTGNVPYLACFAVEGCGSRDITGAAVCERVLDAATTALMASVTEASDHAVAAALRASVARANHTLMQDNAAQRTFLTASLALCLLTAQDAWFIATGHTIVGRRRDGTWETGDDAARDVWLGEQDVAGVELLHVMQHPLPDAEVMLLGAGAAWQAHGVAWFADAWASGSIAVPANVQQLVERVAASSPTGGALAGLLITGDRSVISAGITATVPVSPSICTR
jgi:hypothetical protein